MVARYSLWTGDGPAPLSNDDVLLICFWGILILKSGTICWEQNKKGAVLVIKTAALSHQSRANPSASPQLCSRGFGHVQPHPLPHQKANRDFRNTFWCVAHIFYMVFIIFTSDFHGIRQKMLFLLTHSPETMGTFCHPMQIQYFNVKF